MSEKIKRSGTKGMSRRSALQVMAGAAAGGILAGSGTVSLAAPVVRRKVTLAYWTWADNPVHHNMSVEAVKQFNESQKFITVELDANSLVQEVREKVIAAYAAGSAPDIAGTVQTNVQDWYDNGFLSPVDPFFTKWDERGDYFDSVVTAMRSKPGQPVLYMPNAILPYILYYRADWFDEAGLEPPSTYDGFIETAKKMTTKDRFGYALRGLDYYAVQPIEPIWHSAGVDFVKPDGTVDFDSPAAISVVAKWLGMYTKDHSCQPTAVNDRYSQLFALMENSKAAMWIYGTHAHPQLMAALGDRIQAVPTPNAGKTNYMLANPEGAFIVDTCKEKEAAFEFLKFIGSGKPARIFTHGRGLLPVRKSISSDEAFQTDRFFKLALDNADTWWHPPFYAKNWINYQTKIAPYWQEALRQTLSPEQYQQQAAALLSGKA